VAKWFAKGQAEVDLRKLPFAKNPALAAYLNSLVNLGLFLPQDDATTPDHDAESEELTLDDLELSPLGMQLVAGYDSLVGQLRSIRDMSEPGRRCTVSTLRAWGTRGGLCEIAEPQAPDRQLLRDVFFARIGLQDGSHQVRRQTLLLIVELCRQLSADGWSLDERTLASAVYFGEVISDDDDRLQVSIPAPLIDIAMRWRMFYFHHYMSVALEGMFAWLVTHVSEKGLGGAAIAELGEDLASTVVRDALRPLLNTAVPSNFGQSSPSELFKQLLGLPNDLTPDTSRDLDVKTRPTELFSEDRLETLIRSGEHLHSPAGLAIPMLLLGLTLGRHSQWEGTDHGNWLAGAATDPYLDLVPPVLTAGLGRRFGRWWNQSWRDLAVFVLSRYIIQQHQAMSFEKTAVGDRCLLQFDSNRVMSTGAYDKIGMGNPRLHSAIRILKDLALLDDDEDGVTNVTPDGARLLRAELQKTSQA